MLPSLPSCKWSLRAKSVHERKFCQWAWQWASSVSLPPVPALMSASTFYLSFSPVSATEPKNKSENYYIRMTFLFWLWFVWTEIPGMYWIWVAKSLYYYTLDRQSTGNRPVKWDELLDPINSPLNFHCSSALKHESPSPVFLRIQLTIYAQCQHSVRMQKLVCPLCSKAEGI